MKNIYRIFVSLGLLGAITTSCNDWLDVRPSDEIKEEYLFETGNGFRTALNGIYRSLATSDLYGTNLKWGIIDGWGQVYSLDNAPDQAGGQAIKKMELLNFEYNELTLTTDKMWSAAWNIVANCNNLAQQTAQADSMLFYDRERERLMILGEAIALRAYMQFDLLRIYAPSPAMQPGGRTFIPYVKDYPAYVNNRETVSYCLEQIINDLIEAQAILLKVDEDGSFAPDYRFLNAKSAEEAFLGSRGYRLNYYAVTAVLARVYLYAGKMDEAYATAKILLKEETKKLFQAITSSYSAEKALKGGNVKMYNDIIFGLYSPKDLVEWDRDINHLSDNSPSGESYLALSSTMVTEIYGADMDKDWRMKYQFEKRGDYTIDYRTLKYFEQSASSPHGKVNNQTIPMIRMSEVYYIAAEALYSKDKNLAKEYLMTVKKGRGVELNLPLDTPDGFMNELIKDARREFFGEGQTFFMFKRLLRAMKGNGNSVAAIEKNMVLPLPDSESNI